MFHKIYLASLHFGKRANYLDKSQVFEMICIPLTTVSKWLKIKCDCSQWIKLEYTFHQNFKWQEFKFSIKIKRQENGNDIENVPTI